MHLFVDVNDNGAFDGNDPWTISNGNGDYSFQGLEPPSYPAEFTVYETVPTGYSATTPEAGYQTVMFNQEGNGTDIDFGNTPNSSRVDLFVLADDTQTFSGEIAPVLDLFDLASDDDCLIELLQSEYPLIDWGFGVGRFEDYYDALNNPLNMNRPFMLNQPIVDDAEPGFSDAITGAILRVNPLGLGADLPESAVEALYQVATGAGFDGNDGGSGDTTDSGDAGMLSAQVITRLDTSGDVPAFSSFTSNPPLPIIVPQPNSDDTAGGVGFREDSTRIVIIGTDNGTKYESEPPGVDTIYGLNGVGVPLEEFTTDGWGSTYGNAGATIQETVTALNDLGVYVIGVGDGLDETTDPRRMLEAFATATGAVNNGPTISIDDAEINGVHYDYEIEPGEPLYFVVDTDLSAFAAAIFSAVQTQMPVFPRDISGTVWNDLNDDGVFDAGESGKDGITLFLDSDHDGELDAGEYQVMTDQNGEYAFENVVPGDDVQVCVVLPTRWGMTPPGTDDYVDVDFSACYSLDDVDFGIQEVTAVADTYLLNPNWFTTDEDVPLQIAKSSLTDNDFETVPSTTNSVVFSAVDDSASAGNVSVEGSNVIYTPAADWSGVDTFLYSLTDGQGYTDWTTVTVNVIAVNDGPRISTDQFRVPMSGELSGDFGVYDVENHTFTADYDFGAEHGTFSMADDGTSSYTPEQGFVGVETMVVNYTDQYGESSGDVEISIFVCDVVEDTEQVEAEDNLGMSLCSVSTPTPGKTAVVDTNGDLLIVESPGEESSNPKLGHVAVYRRQELGGVWVWVREEELIGGNELFGAAVAIRGDLAFVGDPTDDEAGANAGAVYVYSPGESGWEQVDKVTPDMDATETGDVDDDDNADHQWGGDRFGSSLAVDEQIDTLVIGAPGYEFWRWKQLYYTGSGVWDKVSYGSAGAAYVFDYDPTNGWKFDQRLDPNDQEMGAEFGNSVDIGYDTIAVGAYKKDESGDTNAGAAYVYKRATSSPYDWNQDRKLTALDADVNDYFGYSVAVWDPDADPDEVNELVVVGAPCYDGAAASDIGAVYSFALSGISAHLQENAAYWLTTLDPSDGFSLASDVFGYSLDILNGLIAVGAPGRSKTGSYQDGAAYLIDSTNPGEWQVDGLFAPSTNVIYEQFGGSVALGGRGFAATGPGFGLTNSKDEASLHFFPYNRTPAAKDMEMVVANASGTSCECGNVFGIDPFEGDAVSYSIIPAVPGDGYQTGGTFSFEDPANPEVVTYTPTSGYPVSDKFRYKVTDGDGAEDIAEVTVYFGSAQIVHRGVYYPGFYNDIPDPNKTGSPHRGCGRLQHRGRSGRDYRRGNRHRLPK